MEKNLPFAKIEEPHLLTFAEILNTIYEEIDSGHRSAIFSNCYLSNQLYKDILNHGFSVITDKDSKQRPRIVIYW